MFCAFHRISHTVSIHWIRCLAHHCRRQTTPLGLKTCTERIRIVNPIHTGQNGCTPMKAIDYKIAGAVRQWSASGLFSNYFCEDGVRNKDMTRFVINEDNVSFLGFA